MTPVRPPQPSLIAGPVDQLTTPITASAPPMSRKTGAPESPVQAPRPRALALGGGIDEADLQRARLAGGDERRGAHRAAALAVAAHGEAIARDHETVAGGDRAARRRKRAGTTLSGAASLSSATSAVTRWRNAAFDVELGMSGDARDVLEHRLPRGVELDQLVVGARQHAVRGREHEIARERDAGAERAVRAGQHDDGASGAFAGRLRAADHGRGGERSEQDAGEDDRDADHGSSGDPSLAAVSRIQ